MQVFRLRHRLALAALLSGACLATPVMAQAPSSDLAGPGTVFTPGAQAGDSIAAVVNDDIITWRELAADVAVARQELLAQKITPPPDAVLQRQILERMITDKALLQEAERAGIRVTDEQVLAAAGRIAEQNNLTLDAMRREIERNTTWDAYLADLRGQVQINRLRELEVDRNLIISENEIDAFLADQASQGAAGPANANAMLHLAQILVRVPEGSTPDLIANLRARAERLLQQARAGADFAQLAAANSDGEEALRGGDMGPRAAAGWPELFLQATRGLKAGQVSGLVQSGNGFHILKVVDRDEPQVTPGQLPDTGPVSVTQSRASHILIRTSAVMSDAQAQQRLAQLRERLVRGNEDFATLARQYSEDASAPQGGDLGWLSPGETVPAFERAMDSLQPGQISTPIQSQFGWHLIRLDDRRVQDVTEQTRRLQARQLLFQRRLEPAWNEWVSTVRARAFVDNRLPPAEN